MKQKILVSFIKKLQFEWSVPLRYCDTFSLTGSESKSANRLEIIIAESVEKTKSS